MSLNTAMARWVIITRVFVGAEVIVTSSVYHFTKSVCLSFFLIDGRAIARNLSDGTFS